MLGVALGGAVKNVLAIAAGTSRAARRQPRRL
jgi:glycerol-3-phosphate dehydrogenase